MLINALNTDYHTKYQPTKPAVVNLFPYSALLSRANIAILLLKKALIFN